MGISCSCPFSKESDLESELNSILVRSISFGAAEEVKTFTRSISFNDRGDSSEPAILKSMVSGKMVVEGSISFKRLEMETMISVIPPSPRKQNDLVIRSIRNRMTVKQYQRSGSESFKQVESPTSLLTAVPLDSKHEAALKLQKVYKSFRTRRKLADCAVLVEQSWWKVLDYAELKRSSVSFFEIEKSKTAISRWSRARTKAAKVGKGLSKNDRAQKLALQHWLEAIDPRHRYGHNLQFYYNKWLECQSRQPFFYWLDIGEGKEINLLDACPRQKLQHQCIKYLGPMEREVFEVIIKDGKFFYKQSEELLSTRGELDNVKWIFVLSTSRSLYVGQKMKGNFQHSSFLAGGATSAAGRLVVENGTLKAVWPHSGHYRPTEENFKDFLLFLEENNVDLSDVKMGLVDDDQDVLNKQKSSVGVPSNLSEEDLTETVTGPWNEDQFSPEKRREEVTFTASLDLDKENSRKLLQYCRQLTSLVIPTKDDQIFRLSGKSHCSLGHGTSIHDQDDDDDEIETVPQEKILQRINSHNGMKSYQLGRQLSCKWSSGAGPRIGCVRDYPSELQTHALEKVSLSPRSGRFSKQNSNSGLITSSTSPTTPSFSNTDHFFINESPSLLGKTNLKPLCSPLSRGKPIAATAAAK